MGWKSVIGVGQANYDTSDLTDNAGNSWYAYGPVGGPICTKSWDGSAPTGTQAGGYLNNHSAYTSSNMGLLMSSSSAALNNDILHFLVYGPVGAQVQGNQLLTILSYAHHSNSLYTNNTAITDVTHSDAIAGAPPGSGSPIQVEFAEGWGVLGTTTGGTGQAIYTGVYWNADQPGGASVPWSNSVGQYNATGGTGTTTPHWAGVTGSVATANTAEVGYAQMAVPNAGTWFGLMLNIKTPLPGNPHAQTAPFSSCVSPSFITSQTPIPGNQLLTVYGDVGTGVLDDPVGTDAVPAGYFVNTQIKDTLSGNFYYWTSGSTFTSAEPNITPFTCTDQPSAFGSGTQGNSIGYTIPRTGGGGAGLAALEQPAHMPCGSTFEGLNVVMSATSTGGTFVSYPNGANGNQLGPISASVGQSSDVTHSDAVPAGVYFTVNFGNMTNAFSLASQSAAVRTPEGTGGLGLGL
jgi:hypothetical protein